MDHNLVFLHALMTYYDVITHCMIDQIFEALRTENIIDLRTEIVCMNSTSIKVHPDAAGAKKLSGEQSIGRSKGGSQQRFIWLPRSKDVH